LIRAELRAGLAEALPKAMAATAAPAASAVTALLTTAQVAEMLQAKPKAVCAWIRSGQLAARKRGRRYLVARADVERFLAASQRPAGVAEHDVGEQVDRIFGRLTRIGGRDG
jgi:excisionase family DNA binding protein